MTLAAPETPHAESYNLQTVWIWAQEGIASEDVASARADSAANKRQSEILDDIIAPNKIKS